MSRAATDDLVAALLRQQRLRRARPQGHRRVWEPQSIAPRPRSGQTPRADFCEDATVESIRKNVRDDMTPPYVPLLPARS